MNENASDTDAWLVARIASLERANRRLTIGLAALGMTLVSVCLAAVFVVQSLDGSTLGGPSTGGASAGQLVADDLTLRGALRVVDEEGRSLVFIGREGAAAGSAESKGHTVIGLFSAASEQPPEQTVRLATSALGSALSLSTPSGSDSASVFAGESGASLELRHGEASRVFSSLPADAANERPVERVGKRAESTARAPAERPGADVVVDLADASLQPLGDGLYAAQLALSDQSGVTRLTGRLVNTTSVDWRRAELQLTVAGRTLPFSVGNVAAGGSTAFSIELPAANAAALRSARMRWLRSTLRYASD